MFAPDRIVAHNLNPGCPGGTELCGYMEREWNSTPHILGRFGKGKGKDKEPAKTVKSPVALETKVVRPTRSRLKIPFW